MAEWRVGDEELWALFDAQCPAIWEGPGKAIQETVRQGREPTLRELEAFAFDMFRRGIAAAGGLREGK